MSLKYSNYRVTSPEFYDEAAGYHKKVLFSTRTSEALALPSVYIDCLEKGQYHELPAPIVAHLQQIKVLVPAAENELALVMDENAQSSKHNQTCYYVVQPSAQCQLGCDYCGQVHENLSVNQKLIDDIVARVTQKLDARAQDPYTKLSMGWFGGEPLAALNKIRLLTSPLKALAEARGMDYDCIMPTNGLSLTPQVYQELVHDLGATGLEVTLDGTAQYHDQRRHRKNGTPTFERIFKNLEDIIALPGFENDGCALTLRCNVDERNEAGVLPLIDLLAGHGFHKKCVLYFAPIHSWGNDAHELAHEKATFAKKELKWLSHLLQAGFSYPMLPQRKKVVCMAVRNESELVDAYGKVYNCTEVSQVPGFDDGYLLGQMGKMGQNTIDPAKRVFMDWHREIASGEQQDCAECQMLPVCGGACPKQWKEGNIPCPTSKYNMPEKLLLYYQSHQTRKAQPQAQNP